MSFEDAYEGWTEKRLTQIDAARLPRKVRRSTDRWPARSERLRQLHQKRTSLFVANT